MSVRSRLDRKTAIQHKTKRTISVVVLCFVMVFSMIASANAAVYKDMDKDAAAYPFAAYLGAKNIMTGYPDGTFHEERAFTRAQMVVLLCKVKGLNIDQAVTVNFKDVKKSHWAYKYIGAGVKAGLLTGYPGGYFRPDAPVSRAEAAAMLISLTKAETPSLDIPDNITDVPAGHWAHKQIAAVIDAGFVPPVSYEGFEPSSPAVRGQVAQGLAMVLTTAPEYIKVPLTTTLVKINGDVSLVNKNGQSKTITGNTNCQAGDTVRTGTGGEAEIQFPDGSSILVEPSSVLKIISTRGQAVIKASGDPGTAVDFAEFDLSQGKIFGVLASNVDPDDETSEFSASTEQDGNSSLYSSANKSEAAKKAWWKKANSSRVRIKVDMPWTVAGIRGTVWMNEVTSSMETLSVVEGTVNVSTSAGAVDVKEGQFSTVAGNGRVPGTPQSLTLTERSKWNACKGWLNRTLTRIKANLPLNIKRPIVSEQVSRIEDRFADVTADTSGFDNNDVSVPDNQTPNSQSLNDQTSGDQTQSQTLIPSGTIRELPGTLILSTNYIQGVRISGEPIVGKTLTGTAYMANTVAVPKGTILYKWYSGLQADGSDRSPIETATSQEYTLTPNDIGRYMFLQAAFQNSDGKITEKDWSNSIGPVIQPTISRTLVRRA